MRSLNASCFHFYQIFFVGFVGRISSSSSGKIYLHTDVRLIFARNKFELDTNVAKYELKTFTDIPHNPKYSPKR